MSQARHEQAMRLSQRVRFGATIASGFWFFLKGRKNHARKGGLAGTERVPHLVRRLGEVGSAAMPVIRHPGGESGRIIRRLAVILGLIVVRSALDRRRGVQLRRSRGRRVGVAAGVTVERRKGRELVIPSHRGVMDRGIARRWTGCRAPPVDAKDDPRAAEVKLAVPVAADVEKGVRRAGRQTQYRQSSKTEQPVHGSFSLSRKRSDELPPVGSRCVRKQGHASMTHHRPERLGKLFRKGKSLPKCRGIGDMNDSFRLVGECDPSGALQSVVGEVAVTLAEVDAKAFHLVSGETELHPIFSDGQITDRNVPFIDQVGPHRRPRTAQHRIRGGPANLR